MKADVQLGLYRAAFEHAPDAMIIADATGEIVLANIAAHRIFGYELETLAHLNLDQLVPKSALDAAPAARRFESLVPPSSTASAEQRNVLASRNDGSTFAAHVSFNPVSHAGKSWVIAIVRNVSRLRQMEEKLQRIGHIDTLTGLYNRRFFETEVERLSQSRNNVGVVLAALIDLGTTNEEHGHAAGDGVLTTLAAILRNTARGSDIVSRVRGDVIALLLPGVPSEEPIDSLVHRIQRKIAEHNAVAGKGPRINALFSTALASPGIELEASLHEAQRLLAREAERRTSEFAVI